MVSDDKKSQWQAISIIKRNNIKNNSNFYCLNYLDSIGTGIKLKSHEKVFKKHNFCDVVINV